MKEFRCSLSCPSRRTSCAPPRGSAFIPQVSTNYRDQNQRVHSDSAADRELPSRLVGLLVSCQSQPYNGNTTGRSTDLQGISQLIELRYFRSTQPVCSGHPARAACLLALAVTCFCLPRMTTAQDNDSLVVLVEVLQTTDDAGVQASLLKGMLRGMEGQRNVRAPRAGARLAGS